MPASQDQNAKLAKKASTRKVPPPVYEAPEPEEVPRREAQLTAFYMSCDRVLALLEPERLPPNVLAALQGQDVLMRTAILSNAVGTYLIDAIASGGVKTLQQLTFEDALKAGTPFIYNGHLSGKGFAYANKTPALSLTEKLDDPLAGMTLRFDFAKDGLTNETAYSRMSGSTRLFAFGYITNIEADTIRAIPYAIGDLVDQASRMSMPFAPTLELHPTDVEQFANIDATWLPTKTEFGRLAEVPEHEVKELICKLLGEHEVPADWGGEESDVFSANLMINGIRHTGAFLLKGPAKFHRMTPKDCGKNGDQIYRLFNIPAHVYVVQHCHDIGAAVRKTVEAFAMQRSFTAPCRYLIMDGVATARLLRANGKWDTPKKTRQRRGAAT